MPTSSATTTVPARLPGSAVAAYGQGYVFSTNQSYSITILPLARKSIVDKRGPQGLSYATVTAARRGQGGVAFMRGDFFFCARR